ncbi:MAG TPA: hypothetical protein VGD60_06735 [Candidatus Acidoferrales bacterium]
MIGGMVACAAESEEGRWIDSLKLEAGLGGLFAKQREKWLRMVRLQSKFLAGSRVDVDDGAVTPFSILLVRPHGLNLVYRESSVREKKYSLFKNAVLQSGESRGPHDHQKGSGAEIKRHHKVIGLEHLNDDSHKKTESGCRRQEPMIFGADQHRRSLMQGLDSVNGQVYWGLTWRRL